MDTEEQDKRAFERYRSELVALGFAAASVDVSWENYLQGDQVTITGAGFADHQLVAAHDLVQAYGGDLLFIDDETHQRLQELMDRRAAESAEENRPNDRRRAQHWLNQRGLVALPDYDPERETLSDFAMRLEAYCGLQPNSVLAVVGETILLGAAGSDRELSLDELTLVMEAVQASNLFEHDVHFALLGGSA